MCGCLQLTTCLSRWASGARSVVRLQLTPAKSLCRFWSQGTLLWVLNTSMYLINWFRCRIFFSQTFFSSIDFFFQIQKKSVKNPNFQDPENPKILKFHIFFREKIFFEKKSFCSNFFYRRVGFFSSVVSM